jgi:hypothetical protein
MNFMYHSVPVNMVGSVLYPLNQLREKHSTAYEFAVSKYYENAERRLPNRRNLLRRRIEYLDCLWNDVIQSSSVHPQKIADAWVLAGQTPRLPLRMFAIPLSMLDTSKLAIFEFKSKSRVFEEDTVVPYVAETYPQYAEVSDTAHARFREMAGKRPFWRFSHIPHVFYKGSIDTTGLEVITAKPQQS